MTLNKIQNFILTMVLLLSSFLVNAAAVPSWKIVEKSSELTFTATQNNSPLKGKFNSFKGDIHFDPAQLNLSSVNITVDLNSVSTSYAEVAGTLKTSDWFDVKLFPEAVFKANAFTKTGTNTYQANGALTIRDKTLPVTVSFVMEEYTPNKAKAKGTAALKRTAFGVGKGEWASTDSVKDDVQVNFTLDVVK
jgi:polyisoprenoid-binding protein YceI